jgi:hypothetical protein
LADGGPRLFCVHTPPAQLPLPSIRPASACVEKPGADTGMDKPKIAKAKAAKTGMSHLIVYFLPVVGIRARVHVDIAK